MFTQRMQKLILSDSIPLAGLQKPWVHGWNVWLIFLRTGLTVQRTCLYSSTKSVQP